MIKSTMKLTAREQEILTILARGRTNKQIAQQLHISPYTVRDHVSSLLTKFHVCNRLGLAMIVATQIPEQFSAELIPPTSAGSTWDGSKTTIGFSA